MGANDQAAELTWLVLATAGEAQGYVRGDVSGLSVMRFDAPTEITHQVFTSVICLVLQGAKQISIGSALHHIAAGCGLVISVEVPVVSMVTEASSDRPYLAFAVDLDLALLHEIAAQLGTGS